MAIWRRPDTLPLPNKVDLYFEVSPKGLDRHALWCESCRFLMLLEEAPETVSGIDVVVVSLPPGTAKLLPEKEVSGGL